ncbi:Mitochondrial basic amino acids transporter [Microtus ochrogaster]|uniref:Mitochondrial basic amino acids transporter n=1 Tax=Microtus ochrogaster TaxID=79684 RepID=A0A8J6G8P2_MICOH|nr:Mitochondrial basic amino acids transporter [Microtus ochrogaster]
MALDFLAGCAGGKETPRKPGFAACLVREDRCLLGSPCGVHWVLGIPVTPRLSQRQGQIGGCGHVACGFFPPSSCPSSVVTPSDLLEDWPDPRHPVLPRWCFELLEVAEEEEAVHRVVSTNMDSKFSMLPPCRHDISVSRADKLSGNKECFEVEKALGHRAWRCPQVRLQVQNTEKPQYRGTLHCFQSIIKQESVLGLYKGLGSPLMGLTFINALVFGVQGNTLRALGQDSPLNQFLAGAAAGAIQCVICCPMELAKTRLQLQDVGPARTYKGSLDCLVQIYRHEGLRGINRGMVSTLLRETPSFGVYFLTYDVLTRAMGCEPDDHLLVPKLLLAGGTSGITSWLSTYPMDVVKSRLQADGLQGAPRYHGIVDCMRQSYQAEGWRVFTRGLASTLLRAFPVNAATFATVTVVLTYTRGEEAQLDSEAVSGTSATPAGPALAQPSRL